jgi:hypothetical protein
MGQGLAERNDREAQHSNRLHSLRNRMHVRRFGAAFRD